MSGKAGDRMTTAKVVTTIVSAVDSRSALLSPKGVLIVLSRVSDFLCRR
jgi:hypothetical protein